MKSVSLIGLVGAMAITAYLIMRPAEELMIGSHRSRMPGDGGSRSPGSAEGMVTGIKRAVLLDKEGLVNRARAELKALPPDSPQAQAKVAELERLQREIGQMKKEIGGN